MRQMEGELRVIYSHSGNRSCHLPCSVISTSLAGHWPCAPITWNAFSNCYWTGCISDMTPFTSILFMWESLTQSKYLMLTLFDKVPPQVALLKENYLRSYNWIDLLLKFSPRQQLSNNSLAKSAKKYESVKLWYLHLLKQHAMNFSGIDLLR